MTKSSHLTSLVTCALCALFTATTVLAIPDDVLERQVGFTSTNVKILHSPSVVKHLRPVVVEYYCNTDAVVVVDVVGMFQGDNTFSTIFSKQWKCKGQDGGGTSKLKTIHLRLAPSIAYRPDYFNTAARALRPSVKVRAWLVKLDTWRRKDDGGEARDVYYSAVKRDYETGRILPKYSRPYWSPERDRQCSVWYWHIIQRIPKFSDVQTCEAEKDLYTLLDYPAVYNGATSGILRELGIRKDASLEADRIARILRPQLTVEMWVYFIEFCPMQMTHPNTPSCGLFLHVGRDGLPLTPSILINKDGHLQIDAKGQRGYDSRWTREVAKRNVWTRILFTFDTKTWTIHVNHGDELEEGFTTSYTYPEQQFVDDAYGLWNIGGLEPQIGSFTGYMGRVVMNRRKVMGKYQIPAPHPYHPMFELHLTNRAKTCTNFLKWMDSAVSVYQGHVRYMLLRRKDSCPNTAYLLFARYLSLNPITMTTSPVRAPFGLRHHRYIKKLLRRAVMARNLDWNFLEGDLETYSSKENTEARSNFLDISKGLLDNVTDLVSNKGLTQAKLTLKLLKQAACLGNDDAMFYLASHLNNGVGCKVDEIQSLAFFMLGTLNRHMLSTMALGHRHILGLDGAPLDKDVAFMYYKQVADKTRMDRIEHKEGEIMTENIRLIDEAKIDIQTSETGELFQWLKQQAEHGVASAQSELGAMMFHGAQGLNRNLQRALDMFRDAADEGDANAMFNAGIIEYRGIGGLHANKSHGRELIEKSAALKNPEAVGALAWMAMEHDKNMSLAFEMFKKAKKLGNVNAGYYLGHMYHNALVPGMKEPDLDLAVKEYWYSATKGNMDAGILFSFVISRGTMKSLRDINFASIWARFIAETHGTSLAKPMRRALNAFRDKNYELALYLYMQIASSGVEVASFNLAYLCEQNKDGVTSFISKECQWRHYNLTVQREFNMVDAYSYIKMGDHYWYGCRGKRDLDKAADFYGLAAQKGDPHALFNLAFMVEEGTVIQKSVWKALKIPESAQQSNVSLLLELYNRCRESKKSEAYIPCTLAWGRVWFTDAYEQYALYMKISSVLGSIIVVASLVMFISNFVQQSRHRREEADRQRAADVGRRKKRDEDEEGDENNDDEDEGRDDPNVVMI